ncbi:hypothetical protein EV578_115188 [Streptomyces sp. BK205]|nr:hypothetical protein EV578_115188 [Streptomyces sp. BK205]
MQPAITATTELIEQTVQKLIPTAQRQCGMAIAQRRRKCECLRPPRRRGDHHLAHFQTAGSHTTVLRY